jgi:hypothetical protein
MNVQFFTAALLSSGFWENTMQSYAPAVEGIYLK